jgi:hypothetical protein
MYATQNAIKKSVTCVVDSMLYSIISYGIITLRYSEPFALDKEPESKGSHHEE